MVKPVKEAVSVRDGELWAGERECEFVPREQKDERLMIESECLPLSQMGSGGPCGYKMCLYSIPPMIALLRLLRPLTQAHTVHTLD